MVPHCESSSKLIERHDYKEGALTRPHREVVALVKIANNVIEQKKAVK